MGSDNVLIEQAIFTSATAVRVDSHPALTRSAGLTEGEARELACWAPSSEWLLDGRVDQPVLSFFRLTSGAHAVGRSTVGTAAGPSGELTVTTRFLVIPPDALARFANNPFAVWQAADAAGVFALPVVPGQTLASLNLPGTAPAVDVELLERLTDQLGATALGTLVQTAIACDWLAISTVLPTDQILAGLFNLLPVECRSEFTFSLGLKLSRIPPVRIAQLSLDELTWRAVARQGITLLKLDGSAFDEELHWQGWAGCVAEMLGSRRFALLASELGHPRPWLLSKDLQTLGNQILARVRSDAEQNEPSVESPAFDTNDNQRLSPAGADDASRLQRADAAHFRFESMLALTDVAHPNTHIEELVAELEGQSPEALELLERIDDLVFAAIDGDQRALAELEALWPAAALGLSAELIEQSREQYLRSALSIWGACLHEHSDRSQRAVAAIDVLCVLFDE